MKTDCAVRCLAGLTLLVVSGTLVSAQTKNNVQDAQPNPQRKVESRVHGVAYHPLNVKPGLWEATLTIKRSGGLPLSSEMLQKMTPDQRARLEARMNATPAHTNTVTDKECITKEDLEKPLDFSRAECSWTILESTSTRASGTVACETSGVTINGTGSYEAPDPEHMRGSRHMTSTGGGNTMVIDTSFTSTWVGATCNNR